MSTRKQPWWLADAIRLETQGRSTREIAEIIARQAKPGVRWPSHTSVFDWLRKVKAGAVDAPSKPNGPEPRLLAVSPATVRAWLAEPPVDADTAEANVAAWRARHPELGQVDGFDVAEAMLERPEGTALYLLATPDALAGLAMKVWETPYAFDEDDGDAATAANAVANIMEGDRGRAVALLEAALDVVRGLTLEADHSAAVSSRSPDRRP